MTAPGDPIRIKPLSGAIGAEISGVNLADDPDPRVIATIRRALVEHSVVFFRDQQLSAAEQKRFGRQFGDLFVHPNFTVDGSDPEIVEVRREPGDTRIVGEEWHTDTTMVKTPPMGAILYAIETPPHGGDTLFSSQALAWETLSVGMKNMIADLRAWHSDRKVAGPSNDLNAKRSTRVRQDSAWQETRTLHPVVRTHPESGRKMLFVNHSYTTGFENMTEAESQPLLNLLLNHGHRPEFTCRFRWRPGSVAFWDNRSCKHLAVHDAGPTRRIMRRIQIADA